MQKQDSEPTECQGTGQQEQSASENSKVISQIPKQNPQNYKFQDKTVILLIGSAGAGKPAVGYKIFQLFGQQQDHLKIVCDQKPQTSDCFYFMRGPFIIIDTPDIFGTTDNNEDHVKIIINYIKETVNHINVILFMFDRQIEEFDESQKQTLKLFMASIGHMAIRNIGIMFPNLPQDDENKIIVQKKAGMIVQMFKDIGIEDIQKHLPKKFIDCNKIQQYQMTENVALVESYNPKRPDPKKKYDMTLQIIMEQAMKQEKYPTKYMNYGSYNYASYFKDEHEMRLATLKKMYEKGLITAVQHENARYQMLQRRYQKAGQAAGQKGAEADQDVTQQCDDTEATAGGPAQAPDPKEQEIVQLRVDDLLLQLALAQLTNKYTYHNTLYHRLLQTMGKIDFSRNPQGAAGKPKAEEQKSEQKLPETADKNGDAGEQKTQNDEGKGETQKEKEGKEETGENKDKGQISENDGKDDKIVKQDTEDKENNGGKDCKEDKNGNDDNGDKGDKVEKNDKDIKGEETGKAKDGEKT